jgi:hypothetical protein
MAAMRAQIAALKTLIAKKHRQHESAAALEHRLCQLVTKQLQQEIRAERKQARAA